MSDINASTTPFCNVEGCNNDAVNDGRCILHGDTSSKREETKITSEYAGRDVVTLQIEVEGKNLGQHLVSIFLHTDEKKGKLDVFVSWNQGMTDLAKSNPEIKNILYHALDCARNSLEMNMTEANPETFMTKRGKGS